LARYALTSIHPPGVTRPAPTPPAAPPRHRRRRSSALDLCHRHTGAGLAQGLPAFDVFGLLFDRDNGKSLLSLLDVLADSKGSTTPPIGPDCTRGGYKDRWSKPSRPSERAPGHRLQRAPGQPARRRRPRSTILLVGELRSLKLKSQLAAASKHLTESVGRGMPGPAHDVRLSHETGRSWPPPIPIRRWPRARKPSASPRDSCAPPVLSHRAGRDPPGRSGPVGTDPHVLSREDGRDVPGLPYVRKVVSDRAARTSQPEAGVLTRDL
jgi:hypothetical protein